MGFKAFAKEFLTGIGTLLIGLVLVFAGIYLIIYGIFEKLQDPWFTIALAAGGILLGIGAVISLYARYQGRKIRDGLY
jgi:divalent metal cation (Fe/Co/Zn/Cd) transporter